MSQHQLTVMVKQDMGKAFPGASQEQDRFPAEQIPLKPAVAPAVDQVNVP